MSFPKTNIINNITFSYMIPFSFELIDILFFLSFQFNPLKTPILSVKQKLDSALNYYYFSKDSNSIIIQIN